VIIDIYIFVDIYARAVVLLTSAVPT